jgi:hypothetical protein
MMLNFPCVFEGKKKELRAAGRELGQRISFE